MSQLPPKVISIFLYLIYYFFYFIEHINIAFKTIRNYAVPLGRNESRELLKMPKPKLRSISFKYMKNKGNASLGILFQSEPVLSGLFNIK